MSTSFQLKPISKESIGEALQKAERYRLLNEPLQSESICKDILEAEPGNQKAIITMLLSITDQLGKYNSVDMNKANQLIPLLSNEYDRFYYKGIICERRGISILNQGMIGGDFDAYEWLREAMDEFQKAEAIRPAGNDDAILRWNTCARQIMSHNLVARQEQETELPLE